MASHAELHAREGLIGTLIHPGVTSLTFQSFGEMSFVREGDGLRGLNRPAAQEITYGRSHAIVRGGKDALSLLRLGRLGCSRG